MSPRVPKPRAPRLDLTEAARLETLLRYESALWDTGVERIAGVDEAGVGPLAGPVVAAAVILPVGHRIAGVDDSKRLSETQRVALAQQIRSEAVAWAVASASVEEIDTLNIYHAGLLAMRRAVEALAPAAHALLVDARTVPGVEIPQTRIIRGDALSLSIAAASILAKTDRDALLESLDLAYPLYGFARHKGYPTPTHLAALRAHGPCPAHRTTYAPVRAAMPAPKGP
jgi:ribonuclease HII